MRSLSLILATGLLVSVAAGCGGSGDKTSTSSGARGYDATIAALNDLCTRAKAGLSSLGQGVNGKAAHDAPIVKKIVTANDKYVAELNGIEPDPKLKAAFDKYVAAIEEAQAAQKKALAAAETGDDATYRKALTALSNMPDRTHPAARALGAKECGKAG